jgi:hypothetical protein
MSDKARGDWWADKAAELERERNDWIDYAKALKDENEALRKDAERYRWLRECNGGPIGIVAWHQDEDKEMVLVERYADEAIDAAISSPENP